MGQIISLSARITTTILCFMAYLKIIPSNTSLMFVIKMLLAIRIYPQKTVNLQWTSSVSELNTNGQMMVLSELLDSIMF